MSFPHICSWIRVVLFSLWIRVIFASEFEYLSYLKASSGFVSVRTRSSLRLSFSSLPRPASSDIRVSAKDLTMATDNDEQPNLSTMMDTFKGRLCTHKSTMNVVVQELKNISHKLDDRNLADGTYRSGLDCPANNPHPPPPPLSNNPRHNPYYYHPHINHI